MDKRRIAMHLFSLALLTGAAGCGDRNGNADGAGVIQTRFPGQVTAGGGTSGEALSRSNQKTDGNYAGGTPGIAGGSGGNTGGAATGGTVQESGRGPTGSIPSPSGDRAVSK